MAKKKANPPEAPQEPRQAARKHAFQFRITEQGEANLAKIQAAYGAETLADAVHIALHIAARAEIKAPKKKPEKGLDY